MNMTRILVKTRLDFFQWIEWVLEKISCGELTPNNIKFFLSIIVVMECSLKDCNDGDGESFLRFLIKMRSTGVNS